MKKRPNFLQAADPKDFVGYRNQINDYRRKMIKFQSSKTSPAPLLFVIGEHGSGKSSMLRILEKTASAENIVTLRFMLPTSLEKTFQELHNTLKDFREEQTGFTSIFKRSKDINIPNINSEQEVQKAVDAFQKNYTERELNSSVLIIIDDLDFLFELKSPFLLTGLIELADKLASLVPVSFIFSLSKSRWEQIQDQYGNYPNIFLGKLEYSDAEILLRKIGNEVLLADRDFRNEIIKLGDRSPFNLVFAADVVKYFTQKQLEGQESVEELTSAQISKIKEESKPFLSNIDYIGFLMEYYGLSENEISLLERILEHNTPAITKSDLIQIGINPNELNPLIELNLVRPLDGEYYLFTSLSLFEKAGRKSEADIISQLELIVNLITNDYKEGYKPPQTTINRLTKLTSNIKGKYPNAKPIATKMEQLFKLAMNQKQYYAAHQFAIATEKTYGVCGDIEGQGMFLEEAARKFIDTKKLHYAKDLFERSIAVFSHSEWKMKSNAREAANIYNDLAKEAQRNDQPELMRAYLWKAISLLEKAGETKRMQTLVNRAVNTYPSKDDSKAEFFLEMIHEN